MYLGAMPIDRSPSGKGQVEQIKDFIDSQKGRRVYFLFTPEGTRGAVTKWKTGFYHVAQGCDLPVFLAKVDYKKKQTGTFHTFKLTGNKDNDIQVMQAAYQFIAGKNTINQYPPYIGSIPHLTEVEAQVISILYNRDQSMRESDVLTQLNIPQLPEKLLSSLVNKMLIDEILTPDASGSDNNSDTSYQLSLMGKGVHLHLTPLS